MSTASITSLATHPRARFHRARSQASPGHEAPRPAGWPWALSPLAQMTAALDATVVSIALPSAQQALHASDAGRQWVVTAYTLAFAGLLLPGGRLADTFGRRRTFLAGLAGFALASAAGGAAPTFGVLLAARAAQGACAALLIPSALSLLSLIFTQPGERARRVRRVRRGGRHRRRPRPAARRGADRVRRVALVPVRQRPGRADRPAHGQGQALPARRAPRRRGRADGAGRVPGCPSPRRLRRRWCPGCRSRTGRPRWAGPRHPPSAGWPRGLPLLAVFGVAESRAACPLVPLPIVVDRNRGGCYLAIGLTVVAMYGVFLLLSYDFQAVLGYSHGTGRPGLPAAVRRVPGQLDRHLPGPAAARAAPRPDNPRPAAGGGRDGAVRLACQPAGPTSVTCCPVRWCSGSAWAPSSCWAFTGTATLGVGPGAAGIASALASMSQQIGASLGTALLNTVATAATAAYLAARRGLPGLGPAGAAIAGQTRRRWCTATP